jgi:tetratricopeptide (TPR) repeat protein
MLSAGLFVGDARSAEVEGELSRRETYVGLPVTLRIRISNAEDYESPELPEVDGLDFESNGVPSRSSQVTIINGRRTTASSVTYSYSVTPQRPGVFGIPPITVVADGDTFQTPLFQIVASKSETGDLMFVEIEGARDSIYVGQSLPVTLRIWVRPYRDEDRGIVLSEGNMWDLISRRTDWGPFSERMKQLASSNRRPGGREVLREDSEGDPRSYYLYEIDTKIYPQRPGEIDGGEVRINLQYPVALGRSRDPLSRIFRDRFPFGSGMLDDDFFGSSFGSGLVVSEVRPVIAEASLNSIEVKPIPQQGRPADYRGAVGQYQIVTEAQPKDVKAGDPIELRIGIQGDGPMDRVQAPPLSELDALTKDFRVPRGSLAGFVDGSKKMFTTTIRPTRAGIEQIPPIPLSYFDPEAEQFVTVMSKPIPITVEEADTLALDSIVGTSNGSSSSQQSNQSTGVQPSFQNAEDVDLFSASNPTAFRWRADLFALAIGPLFFAIVAIVRYRGVWFSGNHFRSITATTRQRIAEARGFEEIRDAVADYLVHRLRSQLTSENPQAAIGVLRRNQHRDLAIEFERILIGHEHEMLDADRSTLQRWKERAVAAVDSFESERAARRPVRPAPGGRTATRSVASLLWFVLLSGGLGTVGNADELTAPAAEDQQQIVFQEANDLYAESLAMRDESPADAKSLAGRAAEKYQQLVAAGIRHPKLFFNLANAYHQIGENGRAIANFHRSLRLDPTDQTTWANLEFVREATRPDREETETLDMASGVAMARRALTRYVPATAMRWSAIAAWSALWLILAAKLLTDVPAWKRLTAVAASLFLIGGIGYAAVVTPEGPSDVGFLASRSVPLRSGDGESFAVVTTLDNAEGERVQLLHRRADWAKIKTDSGREGWVHQKAIEPLVL